MSGHLNAFWRLTGHRVFAQLGMRAITAAIGVGRLSRDSGRYLVGLPYSSACRGAFDLILDAARLKCLRERRRVHVRAWPCLPFPKTTLTSDERSHDGRAADHGSCR